MSDHPFDFQKRKIALIREIRTKDENHCAFLCIYLTNPKCYCKLHGNLERDNVGLRRPESCHQFEERAKQ